MLTSGQHQSVPSMQTCPTSQCTVTRMISLHSGAMVDMYNVLRQKDTYCHHYSKHGWKGYSSYPNRSLCIQGHDAHSRSPGEGRAWNQRGEEARRGCAGAMWSTYAVHMHARKTGGFGPGQEGWRASECRRQRQRPKPGGRRRRRSASWLRKTCLS
jgi:hypothetical protein